MMRGMKGEGVPFARNGLMQKSYITRDEIGIAVKGQRIW